MTTQLVWFRNDLRLADQPALVAAAARGPVVAIYVLDDDTPGDWRMGAAQRWWLHHSLASLTASVEALGGRLILRRGRAGAAVADVARALDAEVHVLARYEPWCETQVAEAAGLVRLTVHQGTTLAPPDAVLSGTGGRYRIFTPFWKKLLTLLPPERPLPVPEVTFAEADIASDRLADWALLPSRPNWSKGFDVWTPGEAGAAARLAQFADVVHAYGEGRNRPGEDGSSRLSPWLAMGDISVRSVWHAIAAAAGAADAEPFLRELGWRDFATNLVDQFPDIGDRPGRDAFVRFPHRDDPGGLAAWQRGRTGYPIVDAGMRQLWEIGWMHNRVRMIASSFLVKHLLVDWRAGERFFWDTLVDADYGNNSQGWQWVMGSGVDSSPFPRIFAPVGQSAKFDAAAYIRRWVPELAALPDAAIHAPWEDPTACLRAGVRLGRDYPEPIISHGEARARALGAWAQVKGTA